MRTRLEHALLLAALLSTTACSLAPTYHAPQPVLPAHYSDAHGDWLPAAPDDAHPAHWWTRYADPRLDVLQGQLEKANPNLAAAVAHYQAARAAAREVASARALQGELSGSTLRQRQSDDRPLRGSGQDDVYDANTLSLGLDLDLDLWGRLKNLAAAGQAEARATGDDLAAARLALQGQLAVQYLALRGLDRQASILGQSLAAYQQAQDMTQARYDNGIASELDLARARHQLADARAQRDDVLAQRRLLEHAIAELLGQDAARFQIAADNSLPALPEVPAELPSTLLQRRPDIAAAERRLFAANAGIGAARAAWLPDLNLSALVGGQTAGSGSLFSAGNRIWALGPLASLPLLDGGRRHAAEKAAHAEFDEASAHYKAAVLHALREVEDPLGQLQDLKTEAGDQDDATHAAEQARQLAQNSYQSGAVSYLDVIDAQTAALQAQLHSQLLQTRRLQASAQLLVALGGDWHTAH
ncbi:MAG: Outer membrane protein OprM [Stenotrophomonas maltophilia]|nr:MAG: Outer membrane protein OprM [Stenotrophomonas maltophilia]